MWVPVAVWQPCELLYTCYLLTQIHIRRYMGDICSKVCWQCVLKYFSSLRSVHQNKSIPIYFQRLFVLKCHVCCKPSRSKTVASARREHDVGYLVCIRFLTVHRQQSSSRANQSKWPENDLHLTAPRGWKVADEVCDFFMFVVLCSDRQFCAGSFDALV